MDKKSLYKCLILDHDDTVVKSTPMVHYPCFVEYMKMYSPGTEISYEDYVRYNYEPGFFKMCTDIYGMSEKDLEDELAYWREYVKKVVPDLWQGIDRVIREQKNRGGIVCSVSHSVRPNIERDFMHHLGFLPDEIFGYDLGSDKAKPNPYPVYAIMEKYGLNSDDILVVDDMRSGLDMARSAGVDFAFAGWSVEMEYIRKNMTAESAYAFGTPDDLYRLLFETGEKIKE